MTKKKKKKSEAPHDPFNEGVKDGAVDFEKRIRSAFSAGGPLAGATEHFMHRDGQLSFALDVARAIENHGTEVIEAGTGTGKTFAYLTPAILAGCKVIVSTAGKPLQDQLFGKDLPAVCKALGVNASTALLKGRSNYICLYRMETAQSEARLPSPAAVRDFQKIAFFAKTDETGDRARCHGVPDDSPAWPYVTSTAENCLGSDCPRIKDCFVYKARAKAKSSDIVVVNHHLYLSAMALLADPESAGAGDDARMLPQADLTIFDEAHKLPDIASAFFGTEFSTYQLKNTVKEMRAGLLSRFKSYLKKNNWDQACDAVIHAMMDFVLRLDEIGVGEGVSRMISETADAESLVKPLDKTFTALATLIESVMPVCEEDAEITKYCEVLNGLSVQMNEWIEALKTPKEPAKTADGRPAVRWIERGKTEARLNTTPLSFAEDFVKLRQMQAQSAWVFTSATIASGHGDFSHFVSEMGLAGVETHVYASPFNYADQAMLYVPESMPDPKTSEREDYIEALIRESWPVIDVIGGKTFILCTSYRAMRHAAALLRGLISANNRAYEVLVQGEDSRTKLIERFRKTQAGAILVGSMSFWEGIDIKGDALSLVVIDKLPFAPKDDPVLLARSRWIAEQGGNPFVEHHVPLATIALKQGTGRLIRSEHDRGILIIGDRRVLPSISSYGRRFLESLPPFSRTLKLERVLDFWQHPDTWS